MDMDKSKLIQPDEVDENMPFLFVSYSRKDIKEVQMILEILRRNHFRFWYDMGLKSGAEWAEELGQKIEYCSQFMVIITENSIESKYVRKEINMAVDMKSDGQILVLYLRNLILPNGLKFLLGNLQAVARYEYSDEDDFEKAFCRSVSNEILYSEARKDINFKEMEKLSSGTAAERDLMNNYVIENKIGQGGFGEVYLGRHRRTGVSVAIKHGILDTTYRDAVMRNAYKNELNLLGKLANSCSNVPFVVDWFEDDRNVFLVLSFIDGVSLKNNTKSYTESQIVEVLRQLLTILSNIHRRGIINKDIKPGNVIEDEYGALFLIDFNIARDIGDGLNGEEKAGTLGYCPPEQLSIDKGEHIDFSSDIYALGRLVESLLLPDKFDRSGKRIPLRAYRKDISIELESIVTKMTEPDRRNRFQSAEEVLAALDNYQKISLVKRIEHFFHSKRRIREYYSECQITAQKRQIDMKEMADMTAFEEISQVFTLDPAEGEISQDLTADSKETEEHTVFF